MFIGHFGLSFAAKKAAPKVSLATLFMATQLVDIIWPCLLVLDIEKAAITPGMTESNPFEFIYYPYTHSLFMGVVWGGIAALVHFLLKKDSRSAVIVGLCVLSHWFFDLIVHRADLPLSPFGETKVGLGLWNHMAASLALEAVIFSGGIYIYITTTIAKNKKGTWGLVLLVSLLVLFTLANTIGPVPEYSPISIFISLIVLMGILLFLAGWVDKNRAVRP